MREEDVAEQDQGRGEAKGKHKGIKAFLAGTLGGDRWQVAAGQNVVARYLLN